MTRFPSKGSFHSGLFGFFNNPLAWLIWKSDLEQNKQNPVRRGKRITGAWMQMDFPMKISQRISDKRILLKKTIMRSGLVWTIAPWNNDLRWSLWESTPLRVCRSIIHFDLLDLWLLQLYRLISPLDKTLPESYSNQSVAVFMPWYKHLYRIFKVI